MDIHSHPSPNYDARPEGVTPNVLVLHYTGMPSMKEALDRMCDATAQVSAHYLIDEDGTTYQLVEDTYRAWHAGISCWRGRASLNDTSIGIEIVNPGHEWGYRPFPAKQMEQVAALSKTLMDRHGIPARNVVGHSDIAPRRKEDPGELFDWKSLARQGIGLWPETGFILNPEKTLIAAHEENAAVADLQARLLSFGYHIRVDGQYGEKTTYIVKAFQRHFATETLTGTWTRLSEERLNRLLKMI